MFYTKNALNEFLLKGDPNSIDKGRIEVSEDYKKASLFLLRYIEFLYTSDENPNLKERKPKYVEVMSAWGNAKKRLSHSSKEIEMQKFAQFISRNFSVLKDHPYLKSVRSISQLEQSKENKNRIFYDFMEDYAPHYEKDPVFNVELFQKELLKSCKDQNKNPATLNSDVKSIVSDEFNSQSIANAINTLVQYVYNMPPFNPEPRLQDLRNGIEGNKYNIKTGERIK